MKLCTAGTGVQLCLVPLCPEGDSLQPPDHCDTRVRICRHGGDQGVECLKQSVS